MYTLPGKLPCKQFGIAQTTVGKAGFITTLYIIIVPFMGLFLKKKIGINIWTSAVIAAFGHVFLMYHGVLSIGAGDRSVLMCSVVFPGTYPGDRPFSPEGRWCGDFLRAVLYRRCDCKRADAAF